MAPDSSTKPLPRLHTRRHSLIPRRSVSADSHTSSASTDTIVHTPQAPRLPSKLSACGSLQRSQSTRQTTTRGAWQKTAASIDGNNGSPRRKPTAATVLSLSANTTSPEPMSFAQTGSSRMGYSQIAQNHSPATRTSSKNANFQIDLQRVSSTRMRDTHLGSDQPRPNEKRVRIPEANGSLKRRLNTTSAAAESSSQQHAPATPPPNGNPVMEELVVLHALHRDMLCKQQQHQAAEESRVRQRYLDLQKLKSQFEQARRTEAEQCHGQALYVWASNDYQTSDSNPLSHLAIDKKVKTLARCTQLASRLSAPTGQYATLVANFEDWWAQRDEKADHYAGAPTGIGQRRRQDLGQEWRDQVEQLTMEGLTAADDLISLGIVTVESTWSRLTTALLVFFGQMVSELDCLTTLEHE